MEGYLTVAEVVEQLELQVELYDVGHAHLADTRAMAANFQPHELVKVSRTYNDGTK